MMLPRLLLGCVALVAGASLARADATTGQLCLGSSHFEINGPKIRTPGGNDITGNYDRHGFSYVVPTNEQGAGTEIVMVHDVGKAMPVVIASDVVTARG